ncbi:MAG: exodeoxyribonuclease VII large subunit, partial [Clostridia bacterium]|nr:exodeoxyribonuclease VII large subunit [Clostridia bacterium]
VITSDTGAAVRDILNITNHRYPSCEIVMCPVLVQGDMAARDMIKTLDRVYALDGIDTIIIGRGGGSAEDLHCFNDEALARKIYESPFPVISAVGHETDFTICDFVADVRASTPSHAAELAVPDMSDLQNKVVSLSNLLKSKVLFKYNSYYAKLNALQAKVSPADFERVFQNRQLELDRITDKIVSSVNQRLQGGQSAAAQLAARIDALSPLKVMARGFSVITKNGKCISSINGLSAGDNISVSVCDGSVDCLVTSINKK